MFSRHSTIRQLDNLYYSIVIRERGWCHAYDKEGNFQVDCADYRLCGYCHPHRPWRNQLYGHVITPATSLKNPRLIKAAGDSLFIIVVYFSIIIYNPLLQFSINSLGSVMIFRRSYQIRLEPAICFCVWLLII